MKIAFFTTIFPMEERYLFEFLESLEKQSYKQFDLIVVNDGYKNFEQIKQKFNLNIIELNYSNTPAKNREYGINYIIKNGYDILILGDSDDYFSNNRVEVILNYLDKNDIVINDLTLFNNQFMIDNYLSNRLRDGEIIKLDFIKDKNIFGFSNSAIKLDKLKKIEFPKDIIAVDWYFFDMLLKDNYKAIFTNKTTTFYRQYEENLIGLINIDIEKIKKVKLLHYKYTNSYYYDKIMENNYEIKKINNPLWWENLKIKEKDENTINK